MSALDPREERASVAILVEATDPATAAADARVAIFLQESSELLGREAASIMDLGWRQGLGAEEISSRLSIPVEWVDDQLAKLPALYGNLVRSRILWNGGLPLHDGLAEQLAAAGVSSFDATASRTILAHARACETCDDNTTMRIEPIAAFAASTPAPARPTNPSPQPGSGTPADPSSTAAARIAAATAAGTAAAAASTGPTAPRDSAEPSSPVGPRHAPVDRGGSDGSGRTRKVVIGGVIGAVVLIGLVAFLLTRGGSDEADVATGGVSPSTVESRVRRPTTTTVPPSTTTRPPTTTTTTIPPEPDRIEASINGGPSAIVTQGFPGATLDWSATVASIGQPGVDGLPVDPPEIWVSIGGPGVSGGRHPESGSLSVCPSGEPDICNVIAGSYDYTVVLFVDGENRATTVVTLVVEPPTEPAP